MPPNYNWNNGAECSCQAAVMENNDAASKNNVAAISYEESADANDQDSGSEVAATPLIGVDDQPSFASFIEAASAEKLDEAANEKNKAGDQG